MKVLDAGHRYELPSLDGDHKQVLQFVKRCDPDHPERFPGNFDSYPGTTIQCVLRALLNRFRYLQNQIFAPENTVCIIALKVCLWFIEFRAARRHGQFYARSASFAEKAPMCPKCLHTICNHPK